MCVHNIFRIFSNGCFTPFILLNHTQWHLSYYNSRANGICANALVLLTGFNSELTVILLGCRIKLISRTSAQNKKILVYLGFNSNLIFLLIYLGRMNYFKIFFRNALSGASEYLTIIWLWSSNLFSMGKNSVPRSRYTQRDYTSSRFAYKMDIILTQGRLEGGSS